MAYFKRLLKSAHQSAAVRVYNRCLSIHQSLSTSPSVTVSLHPRAAWHPPVTSCIPNRRTLPAPPPVTARIPNHRRLTSIRTLPGIPNRYRFLNSGLSGIHQSPPASPSVTVSFHPHAVSASTSHCQHPQPSPPHLHPHAACASTSHRPHPQPLHAACASRVTARIPNRRMLPAPPSFCLHSLTPALKRSKSVNTGNWRNFTNERVGLSLAHPGTEGE